MTVQEKQEQIDAIEQTYFEAYSKMNKIISKLKGALHNMLSASLQIGDVERMNITVEDWSALVEKKVELNNRISVLIDIISELQRDRLRYEKKAGE